ncbi:MAG: hypothetical protein IH977_01765 [Nitrospinae bacterium]|nr:hypothetical protein [Nitrospinota bacterium]
MGAKVHTHKVKLYDEEGNSLIRLQPWGQGQIIKVPVLNPGPGHYEFRQALYLELSHDGTWQFQAQGSSDEGTVKLRLNKDRSLSLGLIWDGAPKGYMYEFDLDDIVQWC